MSNFNNSGTGLRSTNIPAAFLELAVFLSETERTASTAENPLNNITITFDAEARSAAIAATLPIKAILSESGQIVVSAINYLGATYVFNGNANSDIRATHPPAAFLEMAQIVAGAEQKVTVNQPNNITISMDLEAGTATITAALGFIVTINATGQPIITVVDYLP